MPLTTKLEDKTLPSDYSQLLNSLKNEWINPKESGLPIIIEDRSSRTKSVRLYVIWDRFAEVPRNVRSQLIAEVYKDIHKDTSEQIILIIGYDVNESINVGLLPYKIECLIKRNEHEQYQECQRLMKKFGAWERGGQLELRFNDEENARKIYADLQKEYPGPFWAFVIEVNVEDRLSLEQYAAADIKLL
jgi:hypothetical protein